MDTDGNKTDGWGQNCKEYSDGFMCGFADTKDFNSSEVCCGCGGGIIGNIVEV